MKSNSLKDLREKLRFSLNQDILEEKKKSVDDSGEAVDKKDSKDKDKGKEKKSDNRAYVYRSNTRGTKGRAIQMTYDINYEELTDFLKETVPSIIWTLPKVRETFKAVRDFVGFNEKE